MRDDLKKVICEKERKGDRSYMGGVKGWEKDFRYRNRDDREEDFSDLDCLPKQESMTRRLAWNKRNFSENLGAIRGLIAKNVGKNWDKLFSAICKQVSPTGTNIERHVHQHIPDFIEAKTRMGEKGVEIHGYGDGLRFGRSPSWVPLAQLSYLRADYYVHPVTRCIVKFKHKKSDRARYRREPKAVTRIDLDELHQLHRIDNIWWVVTLAPIPAHAYKKETEKIAFDSDEKTVFYRDIEFIELPQRDILVPSDALGRYRSTQLRDHYGRFGVYGVRKAAANHKVLKGAGLAA